MIADLLGFALELATISALGWWGWTIAPRLASARPRLRGSVVGRGTVSRVLLTIGAPVVWAAVWGSLFSPDPVVVLPPVTLAVGQTAMFLVGAVCLLPAGRRAALTAGVVVLAAQILVLVLTAR